MLKPLGSLRGHCFERCLQIAYAVPEKFWYCEGYADGKPHAWLSQKVINGKKNGRNVIELADEDWALDPTWGWKSRYWNEGRPMEDVHYVGLRMCGKKTVEWMLRRNEEIAPEKVSCSLLKSVGKFDVKELQ